jgi:hypothetical protein
MPTALRDVRSQGQSGKHMLALSFSGFDPATDLPRCLVDAAAEHIAEIHSRE